MADFAAVASIWQQTDREFWLVTAAAGQRRGGLIATFVSNASIVPDLPRVLVGLGKRHYTWELVESSGAFALHLLGADQVPWVWRFALGSGRERDKLEGLDVERGATGSPLLSESLAWLDCRVEARLDTGDRTLYLAEVVDGRTNRTGPLLNMQRLIQVAPLEKLRELKTDLDRDAALDSEAIRTWRERRLPLPPDDA